MSRPDHEFTLTVRVPAHRADLAREAINQAQRTVHPHAKCVEVREELLEDTYPTSPQLSAAVLPRSASAPGGYL